MSEAIRILVVEDHPIARMGVKAMVNTQPDMTVVAEGSDGREAVELFREFLPDVTLLDMLMPSMSGAEVAITIRAEYPEAKLIALTNYAGDEDIRRALAAGMRSFLTKEAPFTELLQTIRVVHSGQRYISPRMAAVLDAQPLPSDLTSREMHVLELIAKGLSNKQIAHALDIAQHTVKNHVKNVLAKLSVQDRTAALSMAIQRGIIHL